MVKLYKKSEKMMKYKEYREILKTDRERLAKGGHIITYLVNSGYRIVTHYRRCKLLEGYCLLYPIYMIQRFIYSRKCIKAGCDIPSHVVIGKGFKIDHTQGIVINSKARIGEMCTIKAGAVIGKNNRGVPVIGDNVMIGVHAVILGDVHVGNNADIGAGAIVTHDVPDSAIIIGEAAHVYRIKGDSNE